MAGKFTADDIFEACRFDMIRDTVFLNRDQCVEAKCGMNELADLCMEVFPTWLGINTIDQGMEMLSKAKNPAARHYIRLMQTAIDNAKWTDRYYSSARVIKKNPAPVMEGRNRKMKRVKESVEDAIRDALQSGDYSMSEISAMLDKVNAQISNDGGYGFEEDYHHPNYGIGDCSYCGSPEETSSLRSFLMRDGYDVEAACDVLDIDPEETVCPECYASWKPELDASLYSEYNDLGTDTRTGEPFGEPFTESYNDIEQAIYDAMTTDGYSYEDIQDCISVANAALMEAYDAFKAQRRELQRKMDENFTRRRRRLD